MPSPASTVHRTPGRRRALEAWLYLYFEGALGEPLRGISYERDYETTTRQPAQSFPAEFLKRLEVGLAFSRVCADDPALGELVYQRYGEHRPWEDVCRSLHRDRKDLVHDLDRALGLMLDSLYGDEVLVR